MARSKPTPERSKIEREDVKAFARRQRPGEGDGEDATGAKPDEAKPAEGKKAAETKPAETKAAEAGPAEAKPAETKAAEAQAAETKAAEAHGAGGVKAATPGGPDKKLPEIEPPLPKGEPWPDATPEPMRPVEPARANTDTIAMAPLSSVGSPPEMPRAAPAPAPGLAAGGVENPTHMPGPRDIPAGDPEDPAPAPGRVPRGDSRSLRRAQDFALIYRIGTFVITRSGRVGTRGQWRVVEYPTSTFASHSYAKECSRFVSEGFSDYRD